MLTFLLTTALPAVPWAAALPDSAELFLKADKLTHEQADNVIKASGNVEIIWSAAKLYADMATYYRVEDLLTASGGVRLEKDGDTFAGDSFRLNISSQKGIIENGRIFVKENNLHVRGKEIEKTGDKDYRISDGSITSCDGERPGWQFKVDELEVTLDDFATGSNAFFYIGDVPVFWLPYLIFPVKTEKQSGFLFPSIGHSTKKGFFLETPYYWDISPSRDATFSLDLQSSRGVGAALEYRYKSLNNGEGINRGYLIYDTQQDRFRGNLELQQQINFSRDTYWRADANLSLDRDFYRDYGTLAGEYNRQYLGATAFLSHLSDTMLLTGGADYQNNLDAPDNRATLQKLPFLTLMGTDSPVGATSLYYAFNTAVTHFERDAGSTGERFALSPQLILQQAIFPGVAGRLWLGYNQRFYHASDAADADGWTESGLFEGGGAVQAAFDRTFDVNIGNTSRLKHLIVPELGYEFRERRDQGRLPFYDYDDRPAGGQMLTVSLHNYLTGKSVGKETTAYRDLLRVSLSQGYQLSGERRDLLVLVDEGHTFADTRLTAEVMPVALLTLQGDARISPYNGNLTNASAGIEAGEPKGDRLGFSWHHAKGLLDYMEGRLTLTGLQPFTFSALGRYSFDRPGFLEKLYTVEYKKQCWSLLLSYRDRVDDKEYTFSFNLSGLGEFKLL
jgi:LPS-assembly protein